MNLSGFDTTMSRELLRLVCDEQVGEGCYRKVYSSSLRPDLVFKFEEVAGCFENIKEWELWNATLAYHPDQSKWLAPCVDISPCGCILVQRRTIPLRESELPRFVPAWMTDLKISNWGWLDGNIVCHDYGLNMADQYGISKKVKIADWF